MNINLSLEKKLKDSGFKNFEINGINSEQWLFLSSFFSINRNSKNLYLFYSSDKAEQFFEKLIELEIPALFYPKLGSDIYEGRLSSEFSLLQRFNCLNKLANNEYEQINIVATLKSAALTVPPVDFFRTNQFSVNVSDIIEPNNLSKMLSELGYSRTPTTEEPGTFSIKGEIFDVYPFNDTPKRIIYFDDMIEEIRNIDKNTLKSIPNSNIENITFSKTQHSLLSDVYVQYFANNFIRPSYNESDRYNFRRHLIKKLKNNMFFDDYPCYIGNFLEQKSNLLDHLNGFKLVIFNSHQSFEKFEIFKNELASNFEEYSKNSTDIKPHYNDVYKFPNFTKIDALYLNEVNLSNNLELNEYSKITVKLHSFSEHFLAGVSNKIQSIMDNLKTLVKRNKKVLIAYDTEKRRKEIEYYLEQNQLNRAQLNFLQFPLEKGFTYENEDLYVISSSDFFDIKVRKVKKSKTPQNSDLFADQLSTLNTGDYLIHKEYGVGKYLGLETLTLAESTSDYLIIEYKDNDKVYLPVYKISLIQKYATNESNATLSNLKTKKFEAIKEKAKQSVKKLAFDLLELQAKRELQKGFQFSPIDHDYEEFSESFKFKETQDQLIAIDNVIEDMTSEKPMDRLVCGDVGFGKTEVAMRASFKAVSDSKQVAVLVPTTVLSFQHYNSFIERFKNFPVNIEFISRFKTTKEINEILVKLKEGKIDILIGTHKILSEKVKFKDLGLLIIDEEQRFGVGHKEKMKLLKENVDTLTLTATPIPRTLQMSFLGIKDLSIIKTAPPRRQTIKSYIIKDDKQTLKLAIEKELSRGGQVFIVHNRVNDIEIFTEKIQKLVPKARIIFAHGQMSEKQLETKISDFYKYKYDVLISTTIIESGIDIPRANTMIVDRADTFGLSQLHQLRGRIGRSDKKAYAYFIIPSFHNISEIANKRLKALQTYAELGSGFNLASSDLEIRGSGDILGAEQSGHIGNIGLELYMELLQDAINEIKGKPNRVNKNIEIVSNFDAYIPNKYIENAGERLRIYKKLSNSSKIEEINELIDTMTDQYGSLPIEVSNLKKILTARINVQNLGIKSINVKKSKINLIFDIDVLNDKVELRDQVLNLFMQRPKIYKINPDYSINCLFKDTIDINTLVEFTEFLNSKLNN